MSNNNTPSKKNVLPLFTLILSLSFLGVMICVCFLFKSKLENASEHQTEVITVTEYIYINNENDNSVSTGNNDIKDESFLVKEYLGQIGIFSLESGEIRYVIERYIKTLPEADKRLLGEGFVVIGMSGIYSIIEDYTG